ncbi:conjugal transfer protein TrbJ [Sphingomonas sp. Leaf230]|uniref:P-type conjugative transfer protein TrbJ n=1 Tax=Sphingomonas sp. Leaf230 TaxID=1735694 RepID=UPI0007012951|nr:P-type conjugative transfer protein TrbJ [Sphingomonas sp. Leaf230]KQN00143.1 conjugal transfer protein TrbJ [Sphingomonas sp. Leaf230]
MRTKILAAKIGLAALIAAPMMVAPVSAQLAVVDVAAVKQTTTTAIQSVAAVAKQVQQYQTQLQQYQNMLQNTAAPAAYIWNNATQTIDNLQSSVNQINALKQQSGGISQYLDKFKDPNYYKSSPCYGGGGCTPAERSALVAAQRAKTATAMAANDATLRGLDAQQAQLTTDSRTLDRIQANAQTAKGQMEAIGYANQLAAKSTGELQQIRGLLLAQNAASAAHQQLQLDRVAAEDEARLNAHKTTAEARSNYTQ